MALPLPTLAAPGAIERRRQLADTMLMSGLQSSPIGHWSQGAARMAHALVGALGTRRADRQEAEGKKAGQEGTQALLQALLNRGVQPSIQPGAGSPAGGAMAAAGNMEPTPAPGADRQALLDAFMKAQGNEWVDPGMKQFAMQQLIPPPEEAYSLSPGEGRFRGDQKIAEMPAEPDYMSPEALQQKIELARAGRQPGAMAAPPAGYRYVFDDNGNPVSMEEVPGGPVEAERLAAEKSGAAAAAETGVTNDIVVQDIDRVLSAITESPGMTTGIGGQLSSGIGGTPAADVAALVDTIGANVSFDKLQAMRAASKTGGALGSITERELALLEATKGALRQSQSSEQMADNLRRLKNVYLDVIHGPGNGPPRESLGFEQQPDAMQGPAPGAVEDGYRFKGGDPKDPNSWEPVS